MSESTVSYLEKALVAAIQSGNERERDSLIKAIALINGSALVNVANVANDKAPDSSDASVIAGMNVNDVCEFANAKTGTFKEFKRTLRLNRVGNRSHDSKTRVTLWTQRRKGKKRLNQRAELKRGARFEFKYSADYDHVTVTRLA